MLVATPLGQTIETVPHPDRLDQTTVQFLRRPERARDSIPSASEATSPEILEPNRPRCSGDIARVFQPLNRKPATRSRNRDSENR